MRKLCGDFHHCICADLLTQRNGRVADLKKENNELKEALVRLRLEIKR